MNLMTPRSVFIFLLFIFALAGSAYAGGNCSIVSGQAFIEQDQFEKAIREFTCVIAKDPTTVEGYRGRIEAKVLLDRYSDAVLDYQRVTAIVIPVDANAKSKILAHYDGRLASDPNDIKALKGQSFALWWFFDYAQARQELDHLIQLRPDELFPNLFRGSCRLLSHSATAKGIADLERALMIAPSNPHARYIVADAYTYGGAPDPQRAFDEASIALDWGLDTPRIHAILGASYNAFGDLTAAARQIEKSISLVTADLVPAPSLVAGTSMDLDLVPGRVFSVPVPAVAGQTISVSTSSRDMWDTILVLLAPDGTPILGADDNIKYFAAFNFVAPATGTYTVKVTSFESVSSGKLTITRK